ncbi:MAG TPA: dihydrolipoamide acetyltransferase family protein, partial [Limnochordia bacterium]
MTEIPMPKLGETVVEGTIGRWLKRVGDAVAKDEALVEVDTDKVNAEIPSPVAGILREIKAQEGEIVPVGAPIAVIEEEVAASAEGGEPPASAGPGAPPPEGDGAAAPNGSPGARPAAAPAGGARAAREPHAYSPAVRHLAAQHGIDPSTVSGTGAGGRVTRRDMLARIEAGARSGPARALPTDASDEVLPLTRMRRTIAERMSHSKRTVPHAWTMVEVDVTNLVRFRERIKNDFRKREGVNLTYLPFVIKAAVEALREYPILNSYWDEDRIIIKKRIHINIAVDLDDGLAVPVIRDADQKSIVGLAHAIADLATRARAGTLTLEDVQGGTFTINNTGAFGSILSAPIINSPQAAILSMETITRRPVVVGEGIAIRSIMNLCCSLDHRVLDGAVCGRFLRSVKQ